MFFLFGLGFLFTSEMKIVQRNLIKVDFYVTYSAVVSVETEGKASQYETST